jgi:hypothetical protein
MRFLRTVAFVAAAFLLAGSSAWAQTSTTSVRGTVTDKSGAAVTNAKVVLANAEHGSQQTATTGATGQYDFVQLTPGTYQLSVEAQGFRRYEQRNLQLLINTPATANVSLDVGATSETVEVTGEATLVNTTDASLGNAFGERQIKELPLEGRNVPDLLTLQAGVAYTGNRSDVNKNNDTRSGAVNGAHSDQSNVTLDGVDVNDQVNGYAFTSVLPVTLDSVQEFRVTTTNYNADQGRSSGAQVSLITKGGTNNFHGALYEYHRNTFTSANDWFVKNSQVASGQPNEPPKLIRNIFGASVGGPILKDRLFFFVNYEGYRQREEASVLRIVPSDSMRDGIIMYQCATAGGCPGGTVQGLTGGHSVPSGFEGLNPGQISSMDPTGIGLNPVVMGYLQGFPRGNDVSAGDGVNYVGFRFKGAVPTNNNWYIARADYKVNASGTHTVFWRGALRNDTHSESPYLPGTSPLRTNTDLSRGYTIGYTATLRPTLLNNFRYGYTRQSFGVSGNNDSQPFIYFRGLNDDSTTNNSSLAVVRSRSFQTPVHNFVDDISWTKGKHSFQFGTNIRFIRNPRSSFVNSFPDGVTNASALDNAGLANTGGFLDPAISGLPAVNSDFNNSYDFPLMTMMGMVSQLDASYNYTNSGTVLPEGAPVRRRWGADEYEFYAQDSFRIKPNLTLTYGLRYSLFSPPWETGGTQVAPNASLGQWFNQRGSNMFQGIGSEADPTVSFDLAGPANNRPGYYHWSTKNFSPRLAFAYSPRPEGGWLKSLFGDGDKTVIRGGFGMVYDRIGSGLLSTFDNHGSFGLSTQLSNDTVFSVANVPRLTSLNAVPAKGFPPAPPAGFPFTPPPSGTGLGIYWGLDDSIKTPYSYSIDLSVGRELPKNMSFQISYVGHLARRLLAQEDVAMPLNLYDPKTGVSYFQAANALAKLYEGPNAPASTSVTPAMVGPTASYWKDMIAPLKPGDQYNLPCTGPIPTDPADSTQANGLFTTSPLQAVYDTFSCFATNETTALGVLDFYGSDFSGNGGIQGGSPANPRVGSGFYYPTIGGANSFFNSQFHSLYAWRSIANANYNAMQLNLRKTMSQGIQFDFNYTYSKSIDLQSDAERVDAWSGLGGDIINSWAPNSLRAVSDFDTTHQFNVNWLAELPFGKGKPVAPNAHGFVQAVIGGWQLSGLARWTSGFPIGMSNGFTWPTNWQLSGSAVQTGPAKTGVFKFPDGTVNLFKDPQGSTGIGAFRNDLPGESGSRNSLRGPGYAGLDAGLAKRWMMPYAEGHSLEFRWEVFNVLNLTRFDVQTVTTGLDAGPSFGQFSGLLTSPRVMQFALRYEF